MEEMGIRRGVRRGCCLSPTLLNIYAEKLTEKVLAEARGIVVGEERIYTIKYADDQAVLAESETEIHLMIDSTV